MVVTRAGRLREGALISDRMVKQERVVAYEKFRDSLIIHKEKNKRNECLMSAFKTVIDIANLYTVNLTPG